MGGLAAGCGSYAVRYVVAKDAYQFIDSLQDGTVRLLLTDPPYFGIVEESWDNQWTSVAHYVEWMTGLLAAAKPKLTPDASVILFGGIGRHAHRPLFRLMDAIETENLLTYRNMITWKKRRAYGKSHDYLFCREEILWYSVSAERDGVVFNIPYLDEKRGYAGWNKDHPAKSEYKRVSNVWDDINELFRPERPAQKPLPLINRLIQTHSDEGDLVVDPFVGWGTTGVSALSLGRRFLGAEINSDDADAANERCSWNSEVTI